jgi:hypothetical protein
LSASRQVFGAKLKPLEIGCLLDWSAGEHVLDKRQFLILCAALLAEARVSRAFAKDGDGDNSGPGGGGGSGSGQGRGRGGDDDADDDDDDDDDDKKLQDDIADKVKNGDIEPLAKILKAALDHTPGKVLAVRLRRRFLAYVYRVKILDRTGRKRELHINAKTLEVIKVS